MKNDSSSSNQNLVQRQASVIYKREPEKRVFVNRTIRLGKIQFFGFDMDYTLAVYKSPLMEAEAFKLVIQRLIQIGYPKEIASLEYDPIFPIRGLWFDSHYGNLLKVDGFGNILVATHGLQFMTGAQIEEVYPNRFILLAERRIYVLNTLFNLPDTYLIAKLVDFFEHHAACSQTSDKTGIRYGDVILSYKSIFQDIREAMDLIHLDAKAGLKQIVISDVSRFVEKDDRIGQLLTQLRNSGRKTFLLTNSDYTFTKAIMTYLLGDNWREYFNIIIVDARKPSWFAEGTVFREVNTDTGALNIGMPAEPLKEGSVYSGGSCDAFRRLVRARGKDVLYIGDHIFGDVLRSKKTRGWRTFLVVPEVNHELAVWTGKRELFGQLKQLESKLADLYKNLDANTRDKPEEAIAAVLKSIQEVTESMDQEYGVFGSLFRSGSRTTFFASQVERYADLYAGSCFNLAHYPTFYFFRAPMSLMPHESTVEHTATIPLDQVEKMSRRANEVRDWKQRMAKAPTLCLEEEEEASGTAAGGESSGQGSTPSNTPRQEGADSEPEEANGTREGNRPRAATDNLNNTDVIVPTHSFVEEDH